MQRVVAILSTCLLYVYYPTRIFISIYLPQVDCCDSTILLFWSSPILIPGRTRSTMHAAGLILWISSPGDLLVYNDILRVDVMAAF